MSYIAIPPKLLPRVV